MKKITLILLILVSLLATWALLATKAFAAPPMKIAVAATDKTPSAAVSGNPGPSPYFLIFNQKGKLLDTLENPYKDADSAGPSVINFLAGKGATVVVAGSLGPKLVEIMKSKNMTAVSFKGSAQDAVKQVLQHK